MELWFSFEIQNFGIDPREYDNKYKISTAPLKSQNGKKSIQISTQRNKEAR